MKKITAIIVFSAMGLVTLSSCKKEHTCECTTTPTTGSSTTKKTVINDTKKGAEAECDKGDSKSATEEVDCEIND